MLANRVRKQYQHFRRRFARQRIEAFRLYDWDIPEIRAVVDWYAGHLVVAEYTRRQSTPEWLPLMGAAAAEALAVPPEHLHLKHRHAGRQAGNRYERLDHTNSKMIVSERDLRFWVNLFDFVDTGLFSDHRNTRQMVREAAAGTDFLNLYCYTGSSHLLCGPRGCQDDRLGGPVRSRDPMVARKHGTQRHSRGGTPSGPVRRARVFSKKSRGQAGCLTLRWWIRLPFRAAGTRSGISTSSPIIPCCSRPLRR